MRKVLIIIPTFQFEETNPEKCAQCHISRKWQSQDDFTWTPESSPDCWDHKELSVFVLLFCLPQEI